MGTPNSCLSTLSCSTVKQSYEGSSSSRPIVRYSKVAVIKAPSTKRGSTWLWLKKDSGKSGNSKSCLFLGLGACNRQQQIRRNACGEGSLSGHAGEHGRFHPLCSQTGMGSYADRGQDSGKHWLGSSNYIGDTTSLQKEHHLPRSQTEGFLASVWWNGGQFSQSSDYRFRGLEGRGTLLLMLYFPVAHKRNKNVRIKLPHRTWVQQGRSETEIELSWDGQEER